MPYLRKHSGGPGLRSRVRSLAREEALSGPEPQAGKRWCRRGVEGAGPYIRARSGVPRDYHHQVSRGAKPPPGTDRVPARDVMLDACSPGEVRAISGQIAGRARKGAGRRRPDTPQYGSGHS